MSRLTIFAKGNLDVRDSLHSCRSGDTVAWNGINEILRRSHPGTLVRLQHEIWARSDALLQATGAVPEELLRRDPPLGPYSARAQFSTAVFDTQADVIVLSIQPDVTTPLVRHRRDGYVFYPNQWRHWPAADQHWLRDEFGEIAALDVDASMTNLARIAERLQERSTAPILVYNLSSVVPGDAVHCHAGLEEILSTRIRRFNLGLVALSQRLGISIVDVDTLVARAGADRLKLDAVHLTPEGCRLVAEEVVRVIDDLGLLPEAA